MNRSETLLSSENCILRTTATTRIVAILSVSALLLILSACDKPTEVVAVTVPSPTAVPLTEPQLSKAATRGDLAEIKSLIAEGAKINSSDALGRTPLHMAAFYSRPKTTALLITNGADVNAKDRVGMTPLHAAVLAGDLQEVELLLNNKADIKAASETGMTPLHLAAAIGKNTIAAALIQRGADPQATDRGGSTPAAYAIKNNHPKTASLLQQYGSKP